MSCGHLQAILCSKASGLVPHRWSSVKPHPQSISSLLILAGGLWVLYVAQLSRNSSPDSSFCRRVVSASLLLCPSILLSGLPSTFFYLVWAASAPLLRPSCPSALGKIPTLSWMLQAEGELTFLGTLGTRSSGGISCLVRPGLGGHLETTWKE